MRRNRFQAASQRTSPEVIEAVRALSGPLREPDDLDPLMDRIGNSRYVLLGEASHGTHEYYTWRAEISKRLILEKGFSFIAVEGDWPDCYRVNRYIKGQADVGGSAHDVLHAFARWPTWMWANEEIVELTEWLRQHNDGLSEEKKVGFYGLDVYSLWDSMYEVLGYLHKKDPATLAAARRAFQCFEPYGEDVQEYARATVWVPTSCEDEVIDLLKEMRKLRQRQDDDREGRFVAEQNALVIKNAEAYYRAMVRGGPDSWNIRDQHMTETFDRLMQFHGAGAKGIVWEHNTHIGDARHTDMADDGMVNIGQLVRERHAREGVVLIGFGSHRGSVIAAREWEAPMEQMPVPLARPGSWEDILHQLSPSDKLLLFPESGVAKALMEKRGHRAIGVVYHPEYEKYGNYVPTVLPRRYDAFLYLDETEALRPLHMRAVKDHEVPETYPSGM